MEENVFQKIRREREEWRTKFLAASPDEQKKMIEEKKANQERAEMERKKAIYDDRKKRFFEKADKQLETLHLLEKGCAIALEVIKEFDGKVLNNRLTNEVNKRLEEFNSRISADLTIRYERDYDNNVGFLRFKVCYTDNSLLSEHTIKIILSPVLGGNRVMFAKTEEKHKEEVTYLTEHVSSWKSAKKEYDKVYKAAEKLNERIKEYSKNNDFLRDWISAEHVISSFYL